MKLRYLLIWLFFIYFTDTLYAQSWWAQNAHTQSDLNTIYAASDYTSYCYGDSSDIWGGYATGTQFRTTNQGFDWNYIALSSPVYKVKACYFFNSWTGVAVGENKLSGNGFIMKTTNSGTTWVEGVPHQERLDDIWFATAITGWAVGRNDYIVRSTDAGLNWTDISSNTGEHLEGVFFTNAENGWVVGRAGTIIHSVDSGNTWVQQNGNTPEDLQAVWFINDSTGWAVGKAGTIIFTNDSGMNWTAQNSNTPEDLFDVQFVNDTTGWTVGKAGTVLKTTDAGLNWNTENAQTNQDINAISMVNDSLGWLCGKQGVIRVYGNNAPNYTAPNNLIAFSPKLFPNPVTEHATLLLSNNVKDWQEVRIYNINGLLTKKFSVQGSTLNINKEDFSDGLYLIRMISADGQEKTLKMLIE